MSPIRHMCVFCGASTPQDPAILAAMEALIDGMGERGIGLVYGGGRVGLMGLAADRMRARGGHVLGVIPRQLEERELAHDGLDELIVVESMHERKRIMYDRSDAFIAFPGGFGTLDETMEILTWKQLGLHDKPVILANIQGYFDGLVSFFQRAAREGLLKPEYLPLYHVATDLPSLFDYLAHYEPHRGNQKPWA